MSRMAINLPLVRHIPDFRGPSSTKAKARPAVAGLFFRAPTLLTKCSFRRFAGKQKAQPIQVALLLWLCFGWENKL